MYFQSSNKGTKSLSVYHFCLMSTDSRESLLRPKLHNYANYDHLSKNKKLVAFRKA